MGELLQRVGGAVPVNIYYSTDGGETVKLAYSFGQNPAFQQKGAKPDAPLLGNPNNKLIARHIHNVAYHAQENAFYACTGDIDRTFGKEVHWLRGTYDSKNDAWEWKLLISVDSNSRYKSGGINFIDGKMFWIADANGPAIRVYDRGIFMCDPKDFLDKSKHTLLFNPQFESANMLQQDGIFVGSHCAPASTYANGIIYSQDRGKTWMQYDLKEPGPRSGVRIQRKTVMAGFAWICAKAGSSEPKCCSSNRKRDERLVSDINQEFLVKLPQAKRLPLWGTFDLE